MIMNDNGSGQASNEVFHSYYSFEIRRLDWLCRRCAPSNVDSVTNHCHRNWVKDSISNVNEDLTCLHASLDLCRMNTSR